MIDLRESGPGRRAGGATDDAGHEPASYTPAQLLEMARAAGAPADVLDALSTVLPEGRYRYLAELWLQDAPAQREPRRPDHGRTAETGTR